MTAADLKSKAVEFFHSGKFAEAVDALEGMFGGFAVDLAESAVPAPVAGIVKAAGTDAVQTARDTTAAALSGQPVAPVAKADAQKLASDVASAINAELESLLPGLLGSLASGVAKRLESAAGVK